MTREEEFANALNSYKNLDVPINKTLRLIGISAIKKQIPKKVVCYDNCGNKSLSERCPKCFEVASGDYCEFCGQKLDWGEANE